MEKITSKDFRRIKQRIDKDNNHNLNTFMKVLEDDIEHIFESEINLIVAFLNNELNIDSDASFYLMTVEEMVDLIEYINDLIEELYHSK